MSQFLIGFPRATDRHDVELSKTDSDYFKIILDDEAYRAFARSGHSYQKYFVLESEKRDSNASSHCKKCLERIEVSPDGKLIEGTFSCAGSLTMHMKKAA